MTTTSLLHYSTKYRHSIVVLDIKVTKWNLVKWMIFDGVDCKRIRRSSWTLWCPWRIDSRKEILVEMKDLVKGVTLLSLLKTFI